MREEGRNLGLGLEPHRVNGAFIFGQKTPDCSIRSMMPRVLLKYTSRLDGFEPLVRAGKLRLMDIGTHNRGARQGML